MKFALISSVNDLDLVFQFDYHLLLAWACKNATYLNFYKALANKENQFLILDNGANESKLTEGDSYINLALDIGVNEVQLPDVYLDSDSTIGKSNTFMNTCYSRIADHNISIMGIPQGGNWDSLYSCWDYMIQHDKINTIGVGYRNILPSVQEEMTDFSDEEWKEFGIEEISILRQKLTAETLLYTLSRLYFLKKKVNIAELTDAGKKIHLLGLWNPYELKMYKKVFNKNELKTIRGCDSAAPIQAAQSYVRFNSDYGVSNKPKAMLDLEMTLGAGQRAIAEYNIGLLTKFYDK